MCYPEECLGRGPAGRKEGKQAGRLNEAVLVLAPAAPVEWAGCISLVCVCVCVCVV